MRSQKTSWVVERAKFSLFMVLSFIPLYLLATKCQAQKVDGNHVLMQDVIIDSLDFNQAQLKDRTKEWFGKTFESGEKVITSESSGSIVGHYLKYINIGLGTHMEWEHTITTDFKDNKVRVKIWLDRNGGGYSSVSYFFNGKGEQTRQKKWFDELYKSSQQLVENLRQSLISKADEW